MQIEPQEVSGLWIRRVATPPSRPAIGSSLPTTRLGGQSKGQEVNTSEKTRKRPGATSYLKNLVGSPLSTESIEWPPAGPPSDAYPLGAQVYLSQARDIFLSVRVYRRVQPSGRRVHKVSQSPYAELGYPCKSAVRRSGYFEGSTRSFESPLQLNGARTWILKRCGILPRVPRGRRCSSRD